MACFPHICMCISICFQEAHIFHLWSDTWPLKLNELFLHFKPIHLSSRLIWQSTETQLDYKTKWTWAGHGPKHTVVLHVVCFQVSKCSQWVTARFFLFFFCSMRQCRHTSWVRFTQTMTEGLWMTKINCEWHNGISI